jgi:hypothetical protein
LLYFTVGFFIDRLSFPPIAGSENPDLLVSPCEPNRHDGALDPAETEVACLATAMIEVSSDHAQRVQKRVLGKLEPDAMLDPIDLVFRGVPFKIAHQPGLSLISLGYHLICIKCHIFIWLKRGPFGCRGNGTPRRQNGSCDWSVTPGLPFQLYHIYGQPKLA